MQSESHEPIITTKDSEPNKKIQSDKISEPCLTIISVANSGQSLFRAAKLYSESFGSMKTFNISVSKCGIIT